MPIATAVDGAVSRWTGTSRALRNDLADALGEVGFADLFRGPGTIAESGSVRIDVQGQWSGPGGVRIGNNIQAQVGNSSLAALRIADTLGAAAGPANQLNVLTAARNALAASGADGQWREVTGTSP